MLPISTIAAMTCKVMASLVIDKAGDMSMANPQCALDWRNAVDCVAIIWLTARKANLFAGLHSCALQ